MPISATYASIILKLIFSLLVLILSIVANRVVGRVLRARIKDQAHAHTVQMLVRNAVFLNA